MVARYYLANIIIPAIRTNSKEFRGPYYVDEFKCNVPEEIIKCLKNLAESTNENKKKFLEILYSYNIEYIKVTDNKDMFLLDKQRIVKLAEKIMTPQVKTPMAVELKTKCNSDEEDIIDELSRNSNLLEVQKNIMKLDNALSLELLKIPKYTDIIISDFFGA